MKALDLPMFQDRQRNQLDELSQLIEPFEFVGNEVLACVPETIPLSFEDFVDGYGRVSTYPSKTTIIRTHIKKFWTPKESWISLPDEVIEKFQIVSTAEEMQLDYVNRQIIGGAISIVKQATHFTDEEMMNIMVAKFKLLISCGKSATAARIAEIADIFDVSNKITNTRSGRGKVSALKDAIEQKIRDNEIMIRNVDLGGTLGYWINGYLKDGSKAALKNIAVFKMMTHSGKAIYSVQGEAL